MTATITDTDRPRAHDGTPWHLSVLTLGPGRHGGSTGARVTALPSVPGCDPALDERWLPLQALPDEVIVTYLLPLLAHLVARTLPGWRIDAAIGAKATLAETAALHALLDELLSQAGPVARRILLYQAAGRPVAPD